MNSLEELHLTIVFHNHWHHILGLTTQFYM